MASQQRIIAVDGGNTPVPPEQWNKVKVAGTGVPVWEALRDRLDIDSTQAGPLVAILTKINHDGISGSRFVGSGTGEFVVPLKRINDQAGRKAKFRCALDLEDYVWPDSGTIRNVSGWIDLKVNPNSRVTGGSQADKEWFEQVPALLSRVVLLPGPGLKVFMTVQIIPRSEESLRESLQPESGEQTPIDCPSIPAINFSGADTGFRGAGVARLVPPVSADLAEGSGLGVVPMIWMEGGLDVPVPALSAMKFETFSFLRSVVRPENIKDVVAWERIFLSEEPWEFPEPPSLMWPRPDPVTQRVDAGNFCYPLVCVNVVRGGGEILVILNELCEVVLMEPLSSGGNMTRVGSPTM